MSDSVEAAIQRAAAGAAATGPATPIVIKEDRSIVVPTAMQQIAVQCDNEANVLHFVCPRNWADIDLAAATLYINVVKPDKSTVAFVCTNVVSSEDTITFDWVVTEPVTDVVGKLSFLVCARDPSDPGNGYRWHSNLCDSLFIAPGIACVAPGDTPDPPHIPLYGTDTTLTEPHVPADAAAVGARLSSLSEKVANLPQADWNQNDSTAADYVKNRPFYASDPVETVLVEESTVAFTENEGLYGAEFSSNFEATVGQTYKVSWDGSVYECTCVTFGEAPYPFIGNLSILGAGAGAGADTGEPFVMATGNGSGIIILTADTSASHTFSISGLVQEVVKIAEKYLPDTVATKSDVEAAASAALRTASTANTAAKNAQTTANNAQTTANNAQTTANNAQTTANNAINAATGSVKFTSSQNLTDAQKKQARTNIGAGTSSFSGNYNDLANKPISLSALTQSDTDATRIDVLDDTITDDAVRICSTQHIFDTSSSIFTNLAKDTIYRYYEGGQQTLYSPQIMAGWKLIDSVNANGTVYYGVGIGVNIGSSNEKYFFISNNGFIIIPDKMLTSKSSTTYFKIQYGGADLTMPIAYLSERFIPPAIQRVGDDLILASSTEGSTKKFKITVDDSGTITATEV